MPAATKSARTGLSWQFKVSVGRAADLVKLCRPAHDFLTHWLGRLGRGNEVRPEASRAERRHAEDLNQEPTATPSLNAPRSMS